MSTHSVISSVPMQMTHDRSRLSWNVSVMHTMPVLVLSNAVEPMQADTQHVPSVVHSANYACPALHQACCSLLFSSKGSTCQSYKLSAEKLSAPANTCKPAGARLIRNARDCKPKLWLAAATQVQRQPARHSCLLIWTVAACIHLQQ